MYIVTLKENYIIPLPEKGCFSVTTPNLSRAFLFYGVVTMQKEIWKEIPDHEGYRVSNLGRVWSDKSQKIKVQRLSTNGYMVVSMRQNTVRVTRTVHRLVMLAFKGKSNLQVNHIDGVKTNNVLSNLEYVTQSENVKHSYRIGILEAGENHHYAKLTAKEVSTIRQKYRTGKYTQKQLAKEFGIKQQAVSKIVNNKRWKHI